MNELKHRDELGSFLNRLKLTGAGVEVGCAFGGYSQKIMAAWKGKKLYMVDPWGKQEKDVYRENTNDTADFEAWYRDCLGFSERDPRVILIRALSVEGAKLVEDDSLDFCYIDGNHSYRHVLEDLDAWFPKVRIGGIIGGHDFQTKTDEGWFCEVDKAVKRWTEEHKFELHLTNPCSSWWFRKTHK